MTTQVERRPTNPAVEELIVLLEQTTEPRSIAAIADQLGAARDRRAIRPLLMRLGDCDVQEDRDVEDAVCRALVALEVMRCSGNLSFSLRPRPDLADDVVETIREVAETIPWRYFGSAAHERPVIQERGLVHCISWLMPRVHSTRCRSASQIVVRIGEEEL